MLDIYHKNRAVFLVIIGAIIISFSGVWVKYADVTPTVSAFYRVFFGFIFLLSATLFRQEVKKKKGTKLIVACFCSILFALDLYFWHASICYIGPGLATILANFQVFLLAITGILFFRERIGVAFILSIPLALLGLFMIVGVNWNELGSHYKTGIYFGFATAVCYTGFILTLKKIQSDKEDFSIFFYLMLVSLISSVFLGIKILHSGESFAIPNTKSWASLISLGLFSQAFGWVLIANALPKIKASYAGLILLLQPALAFIWDVALFSRKTDPLNWAGVAITLSAIYLGMTANQSTVNKNNRIIRKTEKGHKK